MPIIVRRSSIGGESQEYGVPDPSTATVLEDGVAETTGDGDEGNREGEGLGNQGYGDNGSGDKGVARGANGASQVSGGQ